METGVIVLHHSIPFTVDPRQINVLVTETVYVRVVAYVSSIWAQCISGEEVKENGSILSEQFETSRAFSLVLSVPTANVERNRTKTQLAQTSGTLPANVVQ